MFGSKVQRNVLYLFMVFLDMVFGILLLIGLWKGFKNGLFVELASLAALIGAIFGAIHFSYITGNYLSERFDWNEQYISIASFLITFIGIIIIVSLAGKLLTKIANIAMLGLLNKIAGAVFGTLKVAVLLGAMLIFFNTFNNTIGFISDEAKQESILYEPLKEIGSLVFSTVLKKEENIQH